MNELIIIINLCGKDGYPKFKVEKMASERATESPKVVHGITVRFHPHVGSTDATSYQMVGLPFQDL